MDELTQRMRQLETKVAVRKAQERERTLTTEEADVIEAAAEVDFLRMAGTYGPVPASQIEAAVAVLCRAVAELHNANDGRWHRPRNL